MSIIKSISFLILVECIITMNKKKEDLNQTKIYYNKFEKWIK